MALTHSAAYLQFTDPTLLAQVQVSVLLNASTVLAEAGGTNNDVNRKALAWAVLKNAPKYAQLFLDYLIAKNGAGLSLNAGGGTTITVPDATVDAAVAGVWDDQANALASPVN